MEKIINGFVGGLNLLLHPTQIKDDQCQRLENLDVRPANVGNNLTYAALTARYSYQRLHTDNLSFIPHNLIEFVVRGIGSVTYTSGVAGSLNDASFSGAYTGSLALATITVSIDTVGGGGIADQYKWDINGSVQASGVAITATVQSLAFGLSIEFGTTGSTTHHVAADSWKIHVVPNGTRQLIAGGYATGGSAFVVKYLNDGSTATTVISSQAATNTSHCEFLLFNNLLYYTNGNVAWRRWNGVDDVASSFTTITHYAVEHKTRAIYLNDVTNNRPNRVWISNVGTPETVPSGNNFSIGNYTDALVVGVDQTERLILIKEKSLFAMYLAPTLSDSSILKGDDFKGTEAPLGVVWGPFGTFVYNGVHGMQSVSGLYIVPTVFQLYNQLKGFKNQRAALGFKDDQLLITTLSSSGQAQNNRLYLVDMLEGDENQKVYQWNVNFAAFCKNQGTLTFGGRLKALEDDGTNRFIVELDQTASTAEASFDCVMQTKDFVEPATQNLPRAQLVRKVVLDFIAPNITNAVTVECMADGASVQSVSYTPTATGFNRRVFNFSPHLCRGYRISFRISYTQPSSNTTRFAVLRLAYEYDLESRVDQN